MRARIFVLIALVALPLAAQEPRPAHLLPDYFANPEGVSLEFEWRFAPGDDPARALPQYDDSHWSLARPDLNGVRWTGVGWFRRHLLAGPTIESRPLKLTFAGRGAADVYLDGVLVMSTAHAGAAPMIPADRRDEVVVRLRGPSHVVAVRYVYPINAQRPPDGIGFRVAFAAPVFPPPQQQRNWIVALHGALIVLPVFLAFLHFALFGFDRRARENVFYALEMFVFAILILHEYASDFLTTAHARDVFDRAVEGGSYLAIFFGLLTYYWIRTNRLPRSWMVAAGIGVVLAAVNYAVGFAADNLWIAYFGVMLVEVARVERSGMTVRRGGTPLFLASFAAFCIAVVLQVLVNVGVLDSVAGIREVYVFGIIAFAIGMSLYLAYNLGRSRIIELENERKTEELARARRLQLSMLPAELPRVDGLDIAVATQTAAEVGGDYYDVRRDGDGALLFAFGDATGHGLASGILVTVAKAIFTVLPQDGSLASHLASFDRTLREMQPPEFLRMCLALARISPSEARVASAAMPPLLVRRASDGSVVELGRGNVPLGSRFRPRYEEQRMDLRRGDAILFATDGFAEQSRSDGTQFGYDGVAEALRKAGAARDAKSVLDALFAIAQEFRGKEALQDDTTMVVVRVL